MGQCRDEREVIQTHFTTIAFGNPSLTQLWGVESGFFSYLLGYCSCKTKSPAAASYHKLKVVIDVEHGTSVHTRASSYAQLVGLLKNDS